MKRRRLGLALVIALLASLSLTWFLYGRLRRQVTTAAPMTKLAASTKLLEAGTDLTADDLVLVDWPAKTPISGSFEKTEPLIGRILLFSVPANEPIRESLLAIPGSAIGLTAKIPEGMRAVAVETNNVNNVSGFLFPGARVDVLMTLRGDTGAASMTSTVLQNVEVLSTGEKLQPDPAGKPQNVREVTLLLSPEGAQKLVLASTQGTIQFVLRNGSDQEVKDRAPVSIGDLQAGSAPRAATPKAFASAGAKPGPRAKAAGDDYQIETFNGTKRGAVAF